MKQRIIVAVIGIPLLLAILCVAPDWATAALLAALSVVGTHELLAAVCGPEKTRRWTALPAVMGILVVLHFYGAGHGWQLPLGIVDGLLLVGVIALPAAGVLTYGKPHALTLLDVCVMALAGLAIPASFSCLLLLRLLPYGGGLVLVPLVAAFCSDSAALFTGMACGKHKLSPLVSPHKTVEGAVGGLVGGVLGMVSYPNYDLNNYSEVSDARLKAAIEDGSASLADQQLRQWRNKALNDTYEPGSTFKILTLSAALEEGVVDMSSTFECSGSITVMGQTIHCSNTSGHGHQTLKEATGNSCNPAFINCGLGLGTDTFYEYMRSFGLLDGSGIDLAGEATGIFMAQSDFSQLDLACYAFGQNFNVTPISLIAAQAACINGGYLYQPHVVEQIRDSSGAVVYQHDNTPLRQVVSQQTSAMARECLEYVVSDGGGRNGQVKGYRIGGKTGTADKGKTGDVVVSFVAFAPADDPQIIMLIAMDSPARDTGTYPSGGAMVAPVASKIMAEILPYLGIEPTYTAEELMGADTTVPYVVGMTREEAQQRVKDRGFGCQIVGDGDTITDQAPAGGAIIPGNATVILYAGAEKATELCTVPNLLGRTASEANSLASNAGLILRFTGATNSASGSIVVLNQDAEAGAQVEPGTVISVQLGDTSLND